MTSQVPQTSASSKKQVRFSYKGKGQRRAISDPPDPSPANTVILEGVREKRGQKQSEQEKIIEMKED